jgi:FkbM family methyltransferase
MPAIDSPVRGEADLDTTDDQSPFGRYRPAAGPRLLIEATRATWLNRYPVRRVSAALFARMHRGPVDYPIWGHPVRLYPWSNASDRRALWRPDRFDRRELALLAQAMRARSGATFVDVGANAGFYSLFAALHADRDARILAFEPHPALYRRMAFNLRSLGSERVRLFPVALGEKSGSAFLAVGTGNLGESRLVETGGRIAVTVQCLPTVLAEHGIDDVDLLKVDVEGSEYRVLQPLFEQVPAPRWPRHLLIEHVWRQAWRYDCIDRARALGYRVLFSTRSNVALSRVG